MKLFDIDGPVMRGLSLVSDLVMLNLITLLFCLPVITAGASLTSMHAMVMKFHIGENGHIFKTFWKEFKGNLKKSTVIWIFVLVILVLLFIDLELLKNSESVLPTQMKIPFYALAFFVFIFYLNLMPYMAKFENTIRGSLKNALLLTIGAFPRTIGMALIVIAAVLAVFLYPILIPLYVALGLSVPAYLCAYLYMPIFRRINKNAFGDAPEEEEPRETSEPAELPEGEASVTMEEESPAAEASEEEISAEPENGR